MTRYRKTNAASAARLLAPPAPVKVTVRCDFRPHSDAQAQILAAVEDEIDVTCGRRFGKSTLAIVWLTGLHPGSRWGAIHTPAGRFWYVTPTLRLAKDVYRKLKRILKSSGLLLDKNDSELTLTLTNEATVEFKSAEDPDNLLGPGLDGLVIDEKGVIAAHAWEIVLSPMLADPPHLCRRRVMRVGTPRGKRHWTYREHVHGQDPANHGVGGHRSFQFATWIRPEMKTFCDRKRKITSPNAFDQEYGAVFLDSAAGYFAPIHEAYDGKPVTDGPQPRCTYFAGFDIGHREDKTAQAMVEAFDGSHGPAGTAAAPMRLAWLDAFDPIPWPKTKERAVAALRKWNAEIVEIDATPSGAPSEVITSALKPEWTKVHGYDFREGGGRETLLQNLDVMLSTGALKLPGTYENPVYPVLAAQIEGYQWKIESNGRAHGVKGPGLRDDELMSLCLAAWAAKHRTGRNVYASRKVY